LQLFIPSLHKNKTRRPFNVESHQRKHIQPIGRPTPTRPNRSAPRALAPTLARTTLSLAPRAPHSSPPLRFDLLLLVVALIQPASHRRRFYPARLSSPPLRSAVPPIIVRPIQRASHHRCSITSSPSLRRRSITLFTPQ
jgi:hypothetical protein